MKIISQFFDALINRRIKKSARPLGWSQPKAVACWTCNISHTLPVNLRQGIVSAEDFFTRHPNHVVDWFEAPGLAGLWTPNADVKEAYGSSAAYAITLTSLASTTSTLLVGQESTAVSNTAGLYGNYLVGGKITMGTVAPTVNTPIEISLYANVDDTPTYPDTITGSNNPRTLTSTNVKKSAICLFETIIVDAVASRVYWIRAVTIDQFFGNRIPKNHGLFVAQNTGQALHSTAGNNVLSYTPCFSTVI